MVRAAVGAAVVCALGVVAFRPAPRLPRSQRAAQRRPLASDDGVAGAASDDDDGAEVANNATVFSSKKHLSEERYPYEVYDTTPPQEMVGVFCLSPTVGCGDILRVERDDGDQAYVIKRVASKMKFSNGRFFLQSKRADATEVNRASLEKKLARLLPTSGGGGGGES